MSIPIIFWGVTEVTEVAALSEVTEETEDGPVVRINLFAIFQIILCKKYLDNGFFNQWSGSASCSVDSTGCGCSASFADSGSLSRNISFDFADLANDSAIFENGTTNSGGDFGNFGNFGNFGEGGDFGNFGNSPEYDWYGH